MATKQRSTKTAPVQAAPMGETNLTQIQDIKVSFAIRLGRTIKTLDEVTDLSEQSLIELDKKPGEPVDVLVNGKLFARGEVVTVAENFGVRITEVFRSLKE